MPIDFVKTNPGIVVAFLLLIISILGSVIGLLIKILITILRDLKVSVDKVASETTAWYKEHLKCRERQEGEFFKINSFKEWQNSVFEDWKEGRTGPTGILAQITELWKAINSHSHDEKGKVIR